MNNEFKALLKVLRAEVENDILPNVQTVERLERIAEQVGLEFPPMRYEDSYPNPDNPNEKYEGIHLFTIPGSRGESIINTQPWTKILKKRLMANLDSWIPYSDCIGIQAATAETPKEPGKPKTGTSQVDMKKRNAKVRRACDQFKKKYHRLPNVSDIREMTGLERHQIYTTTSYKKGRIAGISAKVTTDAASSAKPDEMVRRNSSAQSKMNKAAREEQEELIDIIDKQSKDAASDYVVLD